MSNQNSIGTFLSKKGHDSYFSDIDAILKPLPKIKEKTIALRDNLNSIKIDSGFSKIIDALKPLVDVQKNHLAIKSAMTSNKVTLTDAIGGHTQAKQTASVRSRRSSFRP